MLAQKRAWARVPIASITKLMTVLVALDHAKWNDVVRVRADAARVGESTVNLRAGERITVGDLVKAALIQSANDAAVALGDYIGDGDPGAFTKLMNEKAAELGLTRTHFTRPDGLDARGHYSTALDVTRLAEAAMRDPRIRAVVRERTGSISGGRKLHTWNDLLGVFRGLYGVKTGHTAGAGWCEVAAVKRNGVTLYTTVLGSPTRSQRNSDLASLLRWGISLYRPAWIVQPKRVYSERRCRLREGCGSDRRGARRGAAGSCRPAARRARRRTGGAEAAGDAGSARRRSAHLLGQAPYRAARARRAALGVASRPRWTDRLLRGPDVRPHRRLVHVIVTVTLNAAIDRTLTVPNFQLGQRHRASQGLTLAGGKGINVARALKRLDVPVVATGLAGGRTGTRIVEELTSEAILNDFVRIADESRTSTAVVDPTAATYTEINEWGPDVDPEELTMLLEKISYLARGADMVVFSGTLPRGVDDSFYADAIRDLNRRQVPAVLDSEGTPLRLGVEAEPFLVTPNQREAEGLVGQEFRDDEDYLMALDRIAEMGARNVLITSELRSFGLFREERKRLRFRAVAPQVEPVSGVGSGDVLLAAFLAARVAGRPLDDSLRAGVAAGAASTLEVGAGRFEPREAGRLQGSVDVRELEPVST